MEGDWMLDTLRRKVSTEQVWTVSEGKTVSGGRAFQSFNAHGKKGDFYGLCSRCPVGRSCCVLLWVLRGRRTVDRSCCILLWVLQGRRTVDRSCCILLWVLQGTRTVDRSCCVLLWVLQGHPYC